MKKISIYLLTFIGTCAAAIAQVDRSKYPDPGPAPQINIGDPATFTLANGLKVFVVENHKLPRVTYSLVLDRDPILEGDKAGLTSLMGDMLLGGTASRSKDELDEAIDRIGARINASSTSASASSLKKYNGQLLELFADVLFNPAFPQAELDKLKKQTISSLAAAKEDPNSIVSVVRNAAMYGKDHPYGETETEETVENLNVEDFKQYYQTYFRPNIAYLAIVGDITVSEAKDLVNKHFENWQKGEVPTHEWPAPKAPAGNKVVLVNRPASAQSVINVGYPLDLKPNNPDVIAASVVSRVLGGGSSGRLFLNLREDKGYTYGAYGGINPGKLVGTINTSASVGTAVTDSATQEFIHELKRLSEKTITQEELDLAKAALAGSFGRSLEQPATIANFAINTELQKLPKDYYKNYLKNLDAITLEQVNNIAAKYVQGDNLQITIVGKTDDFAGKMERFGDVQFYTVTGDPEVKKEITDTDITAERIIAKYIDAIGGRENLMAVNTLKLISEAEIQGMTITIEQLVDKEKGRAVQNTKLGDQTLSKVLVTPDKVTVSAQGQTQELPAEAASAYQALLDIFPELTYEERRVTLALDGIGQVNGEDAYKVKVTQGETTSVEYFSVASGLKLKTESPLSGETTVDKYTAYDGIQMPAAVTVANQMIPMPLKAITKEVVINGTIADEELK
ncbi:Predicted Zn-dependent peptidase [Parapedobacter composti]|uniref:Predicted Zn-dependent peptidase n=1 Tax=Parapedobacter composti TaxID=623281 RepID=A0A1I1F4K9_9SPHI|nr:pitrilysin family protein [Parapedobacter composti]SFB93886.1 Predicted Zn-dependent peptidase [Parapedobacter composti]